jgi:murein DD-endopeptidase MepM/ murein hydrolase activator NlpD
MTDRELLVQIHDDIETHLETTPNAEGIYNMQPASNADETPKGNFSGWVWPVPVWNGEVPVISDGFNRYQQGEPGEPGYRRQHLGVDVMFKNAEPQVPNEPEVTKWFHMPSDVPYLAPGAGHIWFAGKTNTGWTVKIDHHGWAGFPLITYHTHMSELFIDDYDDGRGGLYVPAGFQLGLIGPGGNVNHCHFEMWDYTEGVPPGRVNRALNPAPFLKCFGYRHLTA